MAEEVVAGAVRDETEGCDELPSFQVVAGDGIRGDREPDAGHSGLEGQVEVLQGLLGGVLHLLTGNTSPVVPRLRSCGGVQKGYLRYAGGVGQAGREIGPADGSDPLCEQAGPARLFGEREVVSADREVDVVALKVDGAAACGQVD